MRIHFRMVRVCYTILELPISTTDGYVSPLTRGMPALLPSPCKLYWIADGGYDYGCDDCASHLSDELALITRLEISTSPLWPIKILITQTNINTKTIVTTNDRIDKLTFTGTSRLYLAPVILVLVSS